MFGDLGDGGMQPISGPIYRYNGQPAGSGGRFPGYWDGAWLIHNRGADNGFWKEVRLRKDNNKMLRVQNFLPTNAFGSPNQGLVIGTAVRPGRRAVHDQVPGLLLPHRARQRRRRAAGADQVQRPGQVRRGHRRAQRLARARRRRGPEPGRPVLQQGPPHPDRRRQRLRRDRHHRVPDRRRRVEELPRPGRRHRRRARTPSSTAAPTRSTTCRRSGRRASRSSPSTTPRRRRARCRSTAPRRRPRYNDAVALRLDAADPPAAA